MRLIMKLTGNGTAENFVSDVLLNVSVDWRKRVYVDILHCVIAIHIKKGFRFALKLFRKKFGVNTSIGTDN